MSITDCDPNFGLGAFQADIATASAALQDFANGAARRAADDVGVSFERAGARIARALGRAAFDGEASFKQLAITILEEFAKLAFDRIFTSKAGRAPLFGARAAGKVAA